MTTQITAEELLALNVHDNDNRCGANTKLEGIEDRILGIIVRAAHDSGLVAQLTQSCIAGARNLEGNRDPEFELGGSWTLGALPEFLTVSFADVAKKVWGATVGVDDPDHADHEIYKNYERDALVTHHLSSDKLDEYLKSLNPTVNFYEWDGPYAPAKAAE